MTLTKINVLIHITYRAVEINRNWSRLRNILCRSLNHFHWMTCINESNFLCMAMPKITWLKPQHSTFEFRSLLHITIHTKFVFALVITECHFQEVRNTSTFIRIYAFEEPLIVHYYLKKGLLKKQFPLEWLLSIHLEDYASQTTANHSMRATQNAVTCFVISRRLATRGKKRDSHWVQILKQNRNGPAGLRLIAVSVYWCAMLLSHAP